MIRLVTRCAILAVIVGGLTIAGCGGGSGPPAAPQPGAPGGGGQDARPTRPPPDISYAEYELTPLVVMIGDEDSVGLQQANGVRVVSQNPPEEIVLEGDVPELHSNSVIISRLGDGFAGKVLFVETREDAASGEKRVRAVCEPPKLYDIFKWAHIRFRKTVPYGGDHALAEKAAGSWSKPLWSLGPAPIHQFIDDPPGRVWVDFDVGVSLTLVFELDVDYQEICIWTPWETYCEDVIPIGFRFKASIKAYAGAQAGLHIDPGGEVGLSHTFPAWEGSPFWIGPIMLTPHLDIELGGTVAIQDALDSRFEAYVEATAWFTCDTSGKTEANYTTTKSLQWPDPMDFCKRGSIEPEITLKPRLELYKKVSGSVWATVTAFLRLEGTWTGQMGKDLTLHLAAYIGLKLGIGAGIDILDLGGPTINGGPWTVIDEKFGSWDFPLTTDDQGNPVRKPRADITISKLVPAGPDPPLPRGAPGPPEDVVCLKEVA